MYHVGEPYCKCLLMGINFIDPNVLCICIFFWLNLSYVPSEIIVNCFLCEYYKQNYSDTFIVEQTDRLTKFHITSFCV